ncbi:MAG: PEGA domain-containing protein [Myxococcota bacterium]|nr:PEGA domain-containing protein [Myxococcota bacterium]
MKRILRGLVCAAAVMTATPATFAHAQDGERWLVVTATAGDGDLERLGVIAESATAALRATGAHLIEPVSAADALERSGSRSFRPMPQGLRERLQSTAETMLTDVANGRSSRVIAVGEPMLSEARPHLEAIGRDDRASQNMTNICLFVVRAHLDARRAEDARMQVLECLSQSPDLEEPNATMHPPEVVELVMQQRRGLPSRSSLVVRGTETDPAGCVVRVNGRAIGATPMIERALPAGRYAVQVECRPGAPSRVHVARVDGAQPTELTIDGRFDSTLAVDPASGTITLAYSDPSARTEMLEDDVARIARMTEAAHVLAVASDQGASWLRAFELEGDAARMVGSSRVADPGDAARSRAALGSLLGVEVGGGVESSAAAHTDGGLVPAIAVYATGGAALVAFGVLAGIASAEHASARSECGDAGTCSQERVSGIQDLALGADIALGIGIACIAAATIVLVADPPRDIEQHDGISARLELRGSTIAVSGTF